MNATKNLKILDPCKQCDKLLVTVRTELDKLITILWRLGWRVGGGEGEEGGRRVWRTRIWTLGSTVLQVLLSRIELPQPLLGRVFKKNGIQN